MNTFRFLNFPVYGKSKDFYKRILRVVAKIDDYGLKDQIRRAALSIILNLAEGSAKISDKEFSRFLQLSLWSVNEVVACLDVMADNGYIDKAEFLSLYREAEEIAKQLGGLFKRVKQSCDK